MSKAAFGVDSEGRARVSRYHRTILELREDSYRTQDVDRNGKLRADEIRVKAIPHLQDVLLFRLR